MLNSNWTVEVDRCTRAEWAQMLDLFDDATIYQTWSYGSVRWGERNLSHLVLKRSGEVLGLAQVRIIRPTRFKFGIAYVRWGPLCERRGRSLDPDVVLAMAGALEDEYVRSRKLFLRILPNAFPGTPRGAAIQSAFSRFTPEPLSAENIYRTFLLDLSPSIEDLRKSLDKKWRNMLSGAERNSSNAVNRLDSCPTSDSLRTFCLIYNQMRQRKTFDTTVDVDEFARIQQDLPESQRLRVLICEDKGVPVAGLVASAIGDTAIYLLGATSDAGLKSKGAYLLQWTLIKWLKENGFKWYDLCGIDPEGNPGVYHFKRGLSGADVTQMNPLVACESKLSSAVVTSGLALQRLLRACHGALHFGRALSPQVTKG